MGQVNPADAKFIGRSTNHTYTFDGVTYPGVTGTVKVMDKSGPLMGWAARKTAEAAIALLPTLPQLVEVSGRDAAITALLGHKTVVNEDAKLLGTTVHDLADKIARGESTGPMSADVMTRVDLYERWWREAGWTVLASEALLINPEKGYGGTLDLICRDREGLTVLADLKTGTVDYRGKVYPEIILQLGAYGDATFIETEQGLFGMPHIDRYAVIQVGEEAVREIPVKVGPAELDAFQACLRLTRWQASLKGRAA